MGLKFPNKLIATLMLISFYQITVAQTEEGQTTSSSVLTYAPTASEIGTYKIIRNDHNVEISSSINLEMNLHRRHDEEVIWKVNEHLEILLYPFKPANVKPYSHETKK